MSHQYGFTFDQEKCIQCHGCEMACKSWRNLDIGMGWRQVRAIWEGDYPRIKNLSLSMACMHCCDPQCLAACPEDAIVKRPADGIVTVDGELCSGCQACAAVCPYEIPQFGRDGKMQKCDLCHLELDLATHVPPCVASCPTGALGVGPMTEEEKKSAENALQLLYLPAKEAN